MNGQLSDFLLSRFTICFTLCKLLHFASQISFDMAIWLLQLGQFCCERFFICSAVERTNALTSHTKLERWTYSRGPVKGERGAHVPCRNFKTHLSGFWGENHIPVGILLFYYYWNFSTLVLQFKHIFMSFVTILTVYTSLSRHVHISPRNHWFSCEMMATEHVHNWQPTLPTTDRIITRFWETAHLPLP